MASVFCTNCGSQSSDDSKFCASCGTPLHAPQPVSEPSTDIPTEEHTTAIQAPVQVSEEPVEEPIIDAITEITEEIADEITDTAVAPGSTYEFSTEVPSQTVDQPEPATQEPVATDHPPRTEPSENRQFSPPTPQQPVQHPKPVQVAPQQWESQSPDFNSPPTSTSPYALMGTWNIVLSIILMNIPVIGLIISIVWAAGGCRKIIRRNLARAYLLLLAIGLVLSIISALVVGIFFADVITEAFEALLPGYTIQWGF